jgi:hypothetical protein
MNKSFKYALTAIMGAALVTPALGQNFPDVPDNHWAFEAVNRLKKEGIITGYPDGTFSGKRMITRYEMATMIYAIYTNLKNVTDGLDSQIKALEARVNAMQGGGGSDNGGDMQAALKSLRDDMARMRSWGDDIANLKKASTQYQKELSSLGVDVEKMKKDIADLQSKVGSGSGASSMAKGFSVAGDMNFFTFAGSKGSSGSAPINQDGKYALGNASGAGIDTLGVLHELGLTISTNNESGPNGKATLVVGNMVGLGNGFGDSSTTRAGVSNPYGNGNTSIYLHEMYVNLADSLVGQNFDSKIGRQGVKLGKYVLSRYDNTSFFENERYDNGEWSMDGVNIGFGFGSNAKLNLMLGNVGAQRTTNNGVVQPMTIGAEGITGVGALAVKRIMGANLGFGLGENGGLNLSFVNFDGDTLGSGSYATANRVQVTSADLNYKVGENIKLWGGVGKSEGRIGNSGTTPNTNNKRTSAGVSYDGGQFNVGVNYQKIEANYMAPGDWGRVGVWHNLSNIKQTDVKAGFKLSEDTMLHGKFSKIDPVAGAGNVDSTKFGISHKLNGNWNLMASYEDTKFKGGFAGLTNPNFKFTTLGFGYDLGANTLFKLWYQYTDHSSLPATFTTAAGGAANGAFIGAQLTVKF